jgi:hypothetical protein
MSPVFFGEQEPSANGAVSQSPMLAALRPTLGTRANQDFRTPMGLWPRGDSDRGPEG